MEGNIRASIAEGLASINDQIASGKMDEEDAISAKLQLFNQIRTLTPENVATTEALLGTIGLPVAESAAASKEIALSDFTQVEDNQPYMPSGISPRGIGTGIVKGLVNTGAGASEFLFGADIPGWGFGN